MDKTYGGGGIVGARSQQVTRENMAHKEKMSRPHMESENEVAIKKPAWVCAARSSPCAFSLFSLGFLKDSQQWEWGGFDSFAHSWDSLLSSGLSSSALMLGFEPFFMASCYSVVGLYT